MRHRSEILHALCSSGSSECMEQVMDILLAQGELMWEDYQSINTSTRTLYANGRELLDLVFMKGVYTCGLFLDALKKVLPEEQGVSFLFPQSCSDQEGKEECQKSSLETLLTQRPSLVRQLHDCVDGVLEALVVSGHFTSADCEEVRLPIRTPSQKVTYTK